VQEIERSGASVEEALEAALTELGASEQEVEVRIVQEGRSGFLGLGSQDAVVRVRRVTTATVDEVDEEELEDQADAAADFIEGLLDAMDVDAVVETNLEDGTMYVDVYAGREDGEDGEDNDGDAGDNGDDDRDRDQIGLLIGRRGSTLDAVQELVKGVVQRRLGTRCRVIVDVEDYRKRRRSQLEAKARESARRVSRTGRPETLEPMSPYERKIVHDAVGSVGGVETISTGEDPDRRVMIRRRA
jgi:spoIIIJ-associated protein